MGLETGTYISDLVATNPTAGDLKSEGDDHIRLLKSTIKVTFPNVSGAVTPTHTELNFVDGVTSAIQTQMDLKAPLASPDLTGVPTVPTAAVGTDTTQAASTAFVEAESVAIDGRLALKADLASPALTGTPTVPTAALSTANTQAASTAYVDATATLAVYPSVTGKTGQFLTNNGSVASWTLGYGGGVNLFINSFFEVNQEEYGGYSVDGFITTGEYGHDMWKSISTAGYEAAEGVLSLSGGTLGQRNDDMVALHGEYVTVSIVSGNLTLGATGGASETDITPGNPYTFVLDMDQSTDFITIVAANSAYGIRLEAGQVATVYSIPEPRAEETRCLYYHRPFAPIFTFGGGGTDQFNYVTFAGAMRSGATASYTSAVTTDIAGDTSTVSSVTVRTSDIGLTTLLIVDDGTLADGPRSTYVIGLELDARY